MDAHRFAWLLLAGSVLAEVAGTIALRYADGFTRIIPSAAVLALYGTAIWLMSITVKHLEVGLTYAVWAGCGTALTALLGMLWFGESAHAMRLVGIGLIVVGVIAINLSIR
ncbi:MAG: multidrug efflux SMR transporter [Betaproteobacteria bacterium]|nr:multidrug efflux SMR transporter [Betaproteobacteria bacterium]